MVALYPVKMLNIITTDSMEDRMVSMFEKYGTSGYTILRARGVGSSGVQADISGFDANIFVKAIIPEDHLEVLLDSLKRKINKGYHVTVYITDVEVLSAEKFSTSPR